MSSAITQLSSFSSIANRRLQLHARSYSPRPASFRPVKVLNVMGSDGSGVEVSSFVNKAALIHEEDPFSVKSNPLKEVSVVGESNGHVQEQAISSQPKKGAMIHDFCFGIPFGGLVLGGGVLGFIFSRNPVSLRNGVLFGGALLALSTISLKVWKQGKSSLPFILGQGVLAAALLWKNFQAYSLTKSLFPTGFNAVISAAMLCFYSYVLISGGNPPPKKLKSSVSVESL
ncbi:hypothetical protein ABFS83_10G162700 [Erythranthe nasuta]